MAGPSSWLEWLTELCADLLGPGPPAPGTHEAVLEERRVAGLLNKELRKPPGQRDEELVDKLFVEVRKRQLSNGQSLARRSASTAARLRLPADRQCCAAHEWVRQRAAASYQASHDYYNQHVQQMTEELAAAVARRAAVIVAQPSLHLNLPEALKQPPPRIDMCSACARWLEQIELDELACREHAKILQKDFQQRCLRAAPAAAASSRGVAGSAGPAAAPAVAEAQQAEQQRGGGDSSAGDTEGGPDTP